MNSVWNFSEFNYLLIILCTYYLHNKYNSLNIYRIALLTVFFVLQELIEKRAKLMKEFQEYRAKHLEQWQEEKTYRLELRNSKWNYMLH
jgi:hypothetical protein